MTQCERIIQYMKDFDSITPIEAFRDLGITKLATRISEMIKKGMIFEQELMKAKNRYGEPCTYMKYWLPKGENKCI